MKIVIVGGVAGGANVATRARRLSESAEITMFERGEYVSFANCGLPYHIGGEIQERRKLLVQTPESFRARYNVRVETMHEVVRIDHSRKVVEVRNLRDGTSFEEPYDKLVLSTGAAPLKPELTGIHLPGIFTLRDIADMDAIIAYRLSRNVKHAVVVGGGFIGLEVAEQLHRQGVSITIVESNPQVLMPLDIEMAAALSDELTRNKVELVLADPVTAFSSTSEAALVATTRSGKALPADMAVFSIGVRPESKLAAEAGLELGERGSIVVDQYLRTSDESIFALGDATQTTHRVSGRPAVVPLAGPANRAGRLVADNILSSGELTPFRGPLGTAIIRVFELTAACTGLNEKTLKALGMPYKALHLHPNSHASYYPGAEPIALKLLFNPERGTIYGAQAVGKDGIDKRIDVIATAIAGELTVEELIDLDLSYAPPFGSAKDPVNLAGMAASNVRRELVNPITWSELPLLSEKHTVLDVRDVSEREKGFIPDSIHIPLGELRGRIGELPKNETIVAYCQSGQRSYNACRVLSQHGFRCMNLTGAYKTWKAAQPRSTVS